MHDSGWVFRVVDWDGRFETARTLKKAGSRAEVAVSTDLPGGVCAGSEPWLRRTPTLAVLATWRTLPAFARRPHRLRPGRAIDCCQCGTPLPNLVRRQRRRSVVTARRHCFVRRASRGRFARVFRRPEAVAPPSPPIAGDTRHIGRTQFARLRGTCLAAPACSIAPGTGGLRWGCRYLCGQRFAVGGIRFDGSAVARLGWDLPPGRAGGLPNDEREVFDLVYYQGLPQMSHNVPVRQCHGRSHDHHPHRTG